MGQTRYKHSCALGGFSPQGITVIEDDDRLLSGRLFHCQFEVTDPLVEFINGDVLPRIRSESKYTRAIKHDDHTLILVHGDSAEETPSQALVPFVNTFKGFIGLLEHDDHDEFWLLKYGTPAKPFGSHGATITPDPLADVMAVSSETGPFVHIEHN